VRLRFFFGLGPALLLLSASREARAFCRTTTCTPPVGFLPQPGYCVPPGFDSCQMNGRTVKNVPLFWRNACVGYSMQKDASRLDSLPEATAAMANAFNAWQSAQCSGGVPSITAHDLGVVACTEATFSQQGPNQNAVIFRDGGWPHKSQAELATGAPSPTIALTTVSFNSDTGEILDADIELNTADHSIIVTAAPSAGVYDLQSVLTHEAGHFMGLAHSPDRSSVMYYEDEGGSANHHELIGDDVSAICTVYPPSGVRPVDPVADPTGGVKATACDPTPRGGWSASCPPPDTTTSSQSGGCSAAPVGGEDLAPLALVLAGALAVRRRRLNSRRS
jgi:uncharacterized protein (TIGR03382 family)